MQPISLLASGSRATAGLPRDASAPSQEGVSEPKKPSQPARRDRGRKRDARTHEGKSWRLKCQAGTDMLPKEGQAWHPGSTLNSGRPSPTAHPRRPARPVHPPAPITRDSPVASRPQGWTTTKTHRQDGHTRPSGLEKPPAPSSRQRQAAYPGPRQVCSRGPLSALLMSGQRLCILGAKILLQGRLLWKPAGSCGR